MCLASTRPSPVSSVQERVPASVHPGSGGLWCSNLIAPSEKKARKVAISYRYSAMHTLLSPWYISCCVNLPSHTIGKKADHIRCSVPGLICSVDGYNYTLKWYWHNERVLPARCPQHPEFLYIFLLSEHSSHNKK